MAKFRVVLLKHGYESVGTERRIVEAAGGEFLDAETLGEDEALRLCEEADAILVRWSKITPELIQRFRRCRIIVRYGIGADNIDAAAATAAGIIVGHVPTYCLDDVSSHALALWLDCERLISRNHGKIVKGGWDDNPTARIRRTSGRTFGLVGLGNIGQATARKLQGWGMTLLACDPFVDASLAGAFGVALVDFGTLCRESDFVSLHVPLLPETRHLMTARSIGTMKKGATLVNTARGPVVETQALLAALEDGSLGAAGLDVFETEPLPLDSPLRQHPRVVLSDHVAWYSQESQQALKQTVAEEAVRVCTGGLPLSLMNPAVLKKLGRWAEWTPPENVRWQLKRMEGLGG